ncbi:zn2cys6 transcription factor [Diplodia corticola]|uniref:Zn2cys6 transcription factor n=1 Tax=Diplodia corticola TaxID=236234 RepID=A0A1J9QXC3_9PEZI|nr:zn2cys6 transcription factor [Diplodia corticola]OJD33678.1 zn2cys6 transcription factor [Diplodia corticola]
MEWQPHTTPALKANSTAVEDLQARIKSLEAMMPVNHTPLSKAHNSGQQPVGTITVKGDRCRYYGSGYQSGLFNRVQNTAKSMLQPSADPDLWTLVKEVQGLWKRHAADAASAPTSALDSMAQLRDQLPEKDVCHFLIQSYFSMYEERLVVLHKPTFMPLFSDFMAKLPQSSSGIEPQIYAAMALAAYHLQSSDHSHRTAAKAWLRLSPFAVIEAWLKALPRRARGQVSILQTRALIILSQQARGQHIEEHWQATNALVRSAMILGLHRDPAQFKSFSPLQADVRRRLWWSVVEMDLWASLSYGMPAALCPEDTDCMPGIRPDAVDLSVYLSGLPRDSCFVIQDFLARSLLGRLAIINIVSHTLDEASRTRLKQLWGEVEEAMKDLPHLVESSTAPMDTGLKPVVIFLKSLHSTLVISVERSLAPEYTPNITCVHSATEILSCLALLAPGSEETNAPEPQLGQFLVEFMHGIYKALTLICMHLDHFQDVAETEDSPWDSTSLFQLLEVSLQIFVGNVAFEHTTLKTILALSISTSLARARSNGWAEKNVVREGLMATVESLRRRLSDATKPAEQSGSGTADVSLDEIMSLESAFDTEAVVDWPSSDWLLELDEAWL